VHRGHQATRSIDAAVQALCCANCACSVFSELFHCSTGIVLCKIMQIMLCKIMQIAVQALCCANCAYSVFSELYHCSTGIVLCKIMQIMSCKIMQIAVLALYHCTTGIISLLCTMVCLFRDASSECSEMQKCFRRLFSKRYSPKQSVSGGNKFVERHSDCSKCPYY
jgi:hypothetical protein